MRGCHYRYYGDSCYEEISAEKLNFGHQSGHMSKGWCSIKETEVCLTCEILILKDTLPGQKNVSFKLVQSNLNNMLSLWEQLS